MKFTIPTKGMTKTMGMQTVSSAMNRYKEDIKFVSDSGELLLMDNQQCHLIKEYWFPESDHGTPSIEQIGGDGPELNDNDQLKYYKNCLYKISKVPLEHDLTRIRRDMVWFRCNISSTY